MIIHRLDRGSLAAIGRVCRRMTATSQLLLFSNSEHYSPSTWCEPVGCSFLRAIATNPTLAQHIRCLTMNLDLNHLTERAEDTDDSDDDSKAPGIQEMRLPSHQVKQTWGIIKIEAMHELETLEREAQQALSEQ